VLKNIGATALGNKAMLLEIAALDGECEYCKSEYPAFKTSILALHEKLETALRPAQETPKKPADKELLSKGINEAKTAAEAFDSLLALGIMSPLKDYTFDGTTDELIGKTIFALEEFNYESALEFIDRLEENINGAGG